MRAINDMEEVDQLINIPKMAVDCLEQIHKEMPNQYGVIDYGNETIKRMAVRIKEAFLDHYQLQFHDFEKELARYTFETMGVLNTLFYDAVELDEDARFERIDILRNHLNQFQLFMKVMKAEMINGKVSKEVFSDYQSVLIDDTGNQFKQLADDVQKQFDNYLCIMTQRYYVQEQAPMQQTMY